MISRHVLHTVLREKWYLQAASGALGGKGPSSSWFLTGFGLHHMKISGTNSRGRLRMIGSCTALTPDLICASCMYSSSRSSLHLQIFDWTSWSLRQAEQRPPASDTLQCSIVSRLYYVDDRFESLKPEALTLISRSQAPSILRYATAMVCT